MRVQIPKVRQNSKSEVKYWVKKKNRIPDRGLRIANMVNWYLAYTRVQTVADVGCGPRGGLFQVDRYTKMFGVDPLWDKYLKAGVVECPGDVTKIKASAENYNLPKLANLTVSINALDHSGNIKKSIENMRKNTYPGGFMFVHVHLRTPKEFDDIHTMEITPEMMVGFFSKEEIIAKDVFDRDYLYEQPKKTPRMMIMLCQKRWGGTDENG